MRQDVCASELYDRTERNSSTGNAVACSSVQRFDRPSPTPSVVSLERYLIQPTILDPISTAVIESTLQPDYNQFALPLPVGQEPPINSLEIPVQSCSACQRGNIPCTGETPTCFPCQIHERLCVYLKPPNNAGWNSSTTNLSQIPEARHRSRIRTFSRTSSMSSHGSHTSVKSSPSRISVDSRGSRRGRKRWIPSHGANVSKSIHVRAALYCHTYSQLKLTADIYEK